MFLAYDRQRSTTGYGISVEEKKYHDHYRGWMMRGVQHSAVHEFKGLLTINPRCGDVKHFTPAVKESGGRWHSSFNTILKDKWEIDMFYHSKSSPSWVVTEYNLARGMKISCMMRTKTATQAIRSFKGWKPMETEDGPTHSIDYGVEFEFKFRRNFTRRKYEKMERDFFRLLRDVLNAMIAAEN
jgi:hypothetical protein